MRVLTAMDGKRASSRTRSLSMMPIASLYDSKSVNSSILIENMNPSNHLETIREASAPKLINIS